MHRTSSSPLPVRPHAPRAILSAFLVAAALGWVAAPAPALAQETPAPPAKVPWRTSGTVASQLFHVTLVAASRQDGAGGEGDLPKAVAKALDDIKDFLPYRGYHVVDSALVRGSGEAHTRLTGPGGTPYEATILFRQAEGGAGNAYLVDQFVLKKVPRMEDLQRDLESARRGASAMIAPMASEPNLTASFRITRGETVVVGSSRIDGGGDAMIVLLTAVP